LSSYSIRPLLFIIESTPFFGDKVELTYDVEAIPALAPKREALWDKVEKTSFLTLNEKRALVGYGPLAGADHL